MTTTTTTNQETFTLIAHKLCPYVQRSVITLEEKGISYKRIDIELADKPEWFNKLSPLGKVPLLVINTQDGQQDMIFESAVICEYLDETTQGSLLPLDVKQKAQHRSWIEFGSNILNLIGKLYNAKTKDEFHHIQDVITKQFTHLNHHLLNTQQSTYFNGYEFGLVDAVFAPVFRYFDVFEQYIPITCMDGLSAVQSWRQSLAQRPSVQKAVSKEYHRALSEFVINKESYLGMRLKEVALS